MFDSLLFQSLIENLLLVSVTPVSASDEASSLSVFQDRLCFQPEFQPMFTVESLSFLSDSAKDRTFYEINDPFGICLFFFRFQEKVWFIGPYVKREFREKQLEQLLHEKHLPASFLIPFKLYYTALPILTVYQVQRTIESVIKSFSPGETSFIFRRLQGLSEDPNQEKAAAAEPPNHSAIYRRYEIENHFLYLIATGNITEITEAYNRMQQSAKNDLGQGHFEMNSQNVLSSLSTLRALVRKAAESGGLSVIKIDEITQKYVQRIMAAQNFREQSELTTKMILELTTAVRDTRAQLDGCSPQVAAVINYLNDHYNKEITLTRLTEYFHWSASAMEKQFKEETGKTLFAYLTSIRIRKAKDLLTGSKAPIQDISLYVGYQDNNYFVKVFKKETGMTPSAYRKAAPVQKS